MASLLKFARLSCQIVKSNPALARRLIQPSCFISTSKKNKDAVAEVFEVDPPKRPFDAVAPREGPNTAGGKPEVHETVTGLGDKDEVCIIIIILGHCQCC